MMITNKSYIFSFVFLLLAFQIACGQNSNVPKNNEEKAGEKVDSRIDNLKKQADEMIAAFNKSDFNKFVELSHPKVIEKVGGQENLISMMKKVFEDNPKIFESVSASLGNSNVLVESEGLLFGVVPQKIEGITHKKRKIVTNDCVVGVSNDDGKTWKFVSGENFDELFPFSKGKLQIIVRKTFVDGIEQ